MTEGTWKRALGALATIVLVGCGSSGNGGPGGGSGGTPGTGGGSLSWNDDGTKRTAAVPAAARTIGATLDLVEISGGDGTAAVALGVTTPPPLGAGTYTCGLTGTRTVTSLTYTGTTNFETCTIVIATIGSATGDHVTGTFSATLTTDGGTKALTNGVFDVPLTVTALATP